MYINHHPSIGKSGAVERVYYEIKPWWMLQWNERQVQDSKREFIQNLDVHSQRQKLGAFIDFCEDTIFEVMCLLSAYTTMQFTCNMCFFDYAVIHTKIVPYRLYLKLVLIYVSACMCTYTLATYIHIIM